MTISGMSVTPDGRAVTVELPDASEDRLHALQRLMGCAGVDKVKLESDLLMWIDDNHIDPAAPVNTVASTLAATATGSAEIHGIAVFTGTADERGAVTSLSTRWKVLIYRALGI
jgi:hypothetical protein